MEGLKDITIEMVKSRKYGLIANELHAVIQVMQEQLEEVEEDILDNINNQSLEAINLIFNGEVYLEKRKEDNCTFFTFFCEGEKVFEYGIREDDM